MSEIQTPPEGTEPEQVTPQAPETETPEIPSEPVAPEAQPEPLEPEPAPAADPSDPDYKQKFVESSKESILNAERVKVANAQLEKLTKTDTPTDEAMRLVYPEWDDLNEVTKKALVKQETQEMNQRAITARQDALEAKQTLDEEIEAELQSNLKLIGKEAAFKRLAKNPKNKGISMETLAKAFLFDVEVPTVPAPQGEALPAGSGGPRGDQGPKKISIEEAAEIRKTDNNRYMELAKAGMIDDDI